MQCLHLHQSGRGSYGRTNTQVINFLHRLLISLSVFLMRVEYRPNPCSSPQSSSQTPELRQKQIDTPITKHYSVIKHFQYLLHFLSVSKDFHSHGCAN
jgi:hypothetical protein